jgi:amidohydrolase
MTSAGDMPPSTDASLGRLLELVDEELAAAVILRHALHREPELAHHEAATAATIAAALTVPASPAPGTAVLARVGPNDRPAVAVRAELDGLPLDEHTGAPFSSNNGVMHACGHDVHAAALVALGRAAQRMVESLPAPMLMVFQPSEESYPSGAEALVRERALGDVRAIVAAHVHPELQWGALALDGGPVNASCDTVIIRVEGVPTHGAYPHRGRDPVIAIAQVVTTLHAELGRRVDPLHGAVLSVGHISAGDADNVVPAEALARATVRALRGEDRAVLRAMVEEVVTGVASAHGCRGHVELMPGEPALDNDAAIVATARDLARRSGLSVAPPWRSCGSDDFAFFGALAPIAMGFAGLRGAPGFDLRPLHHPEFLPPDSAVRAIARVQAVLYVAAAGSPDTSSDGA